MWMFKYLWFRIPWGASDFECFRNSRKLNRSLLYPSKEQKPKAWITHSRTQRCTLRASDFFSDTYFFMCNHMPDLHLKLLCSILNLTYPGALWVWWICQQHRSCHISPGQPRAKWHLGVWVCNKMTVAYLHEVSTLKMNWVPSEALMMWRGPACWTVILIYLNIFPKCEGRI